MEYKVIKNENKEQWFDNNQLVKEIKYYENGQKKYEEYWLNDQLHREDGPAVQEWYENGQKDNEFYFLNDKQVSKDQIIKENKIITIKGKEFSEDTIYKALKDYMDF